MSIKERYQHFKEWQQQPFDYRKSHDSHHCNNCDDDFTGRYCPTCGQKWTTGPVTWKSIHSGVMDVWGMGTRSLPYTIWQLFWRPGYLIGDYISGRRQVSFPPVKMLVLVALMVYLAEKVFGIVVFSSDDNFFDLTDEAFLPAINAVFTTLSKHYDWSSLFIFLLMALPTFIVFRHSPRHTRHTLPQEFFIQVFNSTQFLCLMFLWAVINIFVGYKNEGNIELLVIIPFIMFYNYKQLFGYNFWGTLWRMVVCWILWFVLIGSIVLSLPEISHLYEGTPVKASDVFYLVMLVVTFIMITFFVNVFNLYDVKANQRSRKWHVLNVVMMVVTALLSWFFIMIIMRMIGPGMHHSFTAYAIPIILSLVSTTAFYVLFRRGKPAKTSKHAEDNNTGNYEKNEIRLQATEGDSQIGR